MTTPDIRPADDAAIAAAANLLRAGQLVAFPTETVYGLGADATNDKAVAEIFKAKGRPAINPLIIHTARVEDARALTVWNDTAERLAAAFWPGPLTLILPRRDDCPVSLLASAGLDTIAVRVPAHPLAHRLLTETGRPVAAPSANASGQISPTRADHVAELLGTAAGLILDGGPCAIGLELSVIAIKDGSATLLRHGAVTRQDLEALVGPIAETTQDDIAPQSPGMLLRHYAPRHALRLDAIEPRPGEAFLGFGDSPVRDGVVSRNLSPTGDLTEAASNLFAYLRELDRAAIDGIAVATVPDTGLGRAVNDRLRRAAQPPEPQG